MICWTGADVQFTKKSVKEASLRTQNSLNKLGSEGWELVSVSDHEFIFKRPLLAK